MFELLTFFFSGSALYIIIKIIYQRKCPSDEALRKAVLYSQKFDDPEGERIIAHLGLCAKCRVRIDKMNGLQDDKVRLDA